VESEWPTDSRLPSLAERGNPLMHEKRGMEGALGIVLVRVGSAEHRHDRVADELLDEALVALDRTRQLQEQVALKGADLLRVEGLG
jgi:hypothetical protein